MYRPQGRGIPVLPRRQGNVSPSTGRYFLRLIIVLCQVPSWSRIVFQFTEYKLSKVHREFCYYIHPVN